MKTNKLLVKDYVGTGKIAKMFDVSPRTVAKWIDEGLLLGFRVPGSKHRRATLTEVKKFAEKYEMPICEDTAPLPETEVSVLNIPEI